MYKNATRTRDMREINVSLEMERVWRTSFTWVYTSLLCRAIMATACLWVSSEQLPCIIFVCLNINSVLSSKRRTLRVFEMRERGLTINRASGKWFSGWTRKSVVDTKSVDLQLIVASLSHALNIVSVKSIYILLDCSWERVTKLGYGDVYIDKLDYKTVFGKFTHACYNVQLRRLHSNISSFHPVQRHGVQQNHVPQFLESSKLRRS